MILPIDLIVFCLFFIGQALFINGISISAEGTTVVNPDGSETDSEMLLYPIYKFLHQKSSVKIYYSGDKLERLVNDMKEKYFPVDLKSLYATYGYATFQDETLLPLFASMKNRIEKDFSIAIEGSGSIFKFYVLQDEYKFSKYLRKPTLGCIKCMPSVWGTITFWIFSSLMYQSSDGLFWLWLFDIVALIPTTYYIHRILNK